MILMLTNADSERLTFRLAADELKELFPNMLAESLDVFENQDISDIKSLIKSLKVRIVLIRRLKGAKGLEGYLETLKSFCQNESIYLLGFGGEDFYDRQMAEYSNVGIDIVTNALRYITSGAKSNYVNLIKYLAANLLNCDLDFMEPTVIEKTGIYYATSLNNTINGSVENSGSASNPYAVGIVFYRAQYLASNTLYIDTLINEFEKIGCNVVCVYCYSLREDTLSENKVISWFKDYNVRLVVTTIWAAGVSYSDDWGFDGWESSKLKDLNVPILQAIVSSGSKAKWDASQIGLGPIDVAMSVAIPEFDGRIVGQCFAFKETLDLDYKLRYDSDPADLKANHYRPTPLVAYRVEHSRVKKLVNFSKKLVELSLLDNHDKRVAIVLSAYPTKKSRLGNAVGLDTPASLINILDLLFQNGYDLPNCDFNAQDIMFQLADGLEYDESNSDSKVGSNIIGTLDSSQYQEYFRHLPMEFQKSVVSAWGAAPGDFGVNGNKFQFSGVVFNKILIMIQPPRGFGIDPVAVYHSPDLPPTHYYLAFYYWLAQEQSVHAIVHLGKHGTLEWLPGKGIGLSDACATDVAIDDVPLVYPFIVNDPGEGTQAKRRAHAIIIDHMVPPMTKADLYGDTSAIESILDEYATISAMDPEKLPNIRKKLWNQLVDSKINQDLSMNASLLRMYPWLKDNYIDPANNDLDNLLGEIDGYLCVLKDSLIRGGLHIFGEPPSGEKLIDLIDAVSRIRQGNVPSLRELTARNLGFDLGAVSLKQLDEIEGFSKSFIAGVLESEIGTKDSALLQDLPFVIKSELNQEFESVKRWIVERVLVAFENTTEEYTGLLKSLESKFVDSGPSGAPTRGMLNVLPTGRNFYSLDPKTVPTPISYEMGTKLADAVVELSIKQNGSYPKSVSIVVWGTANMRTHGDDIAQILAFVGVKPVWDDLTGRVIGLELIAREDLKRPRVDVTVRISGFFRDAFPQVIELLDRAFNMAQDADEDDNPLRRHSDEVRIFGPKPGAYGSGILNVLENRNWEADDDLASIYLTWGGYSYSNNQKGQPAFEKWAHRLAQTQIAIKNQDNREHDIFDSDDYLQDHGGMIAAIRSLTGVNPLAAFGDSSNASNPKVTTLEQEAAKVVRTRVVNPKWIKAMTEHGYKGAFEMAASVDYFFGYDATANISQDWMYNSIAESYVRDPDVREFIKQHNPWALTSISERLLEANSRGLWNADESTINELKTAILEADELDEIM